MSYKKKLVAVVTGLTLLGLAGCSAEVPPEQEGLSYEEQKLTNSLKVRAVQMPDGTSVYCVVLNGFRQGGVSCDWERRS